MAFTNSLPQSRRKGAPQLVCYTDTAFIPNIIQENFNLVYEEPDTVSGKRNMVKWYTTRWGNSVEVYNPGTSNGFITSIGNVSGFIDEVQWNVTPDTPVITASTVTTNTNVESTWLDTTVTFLTSVGGGAEGMYVWWDPEEIMYDNPVVQSTPLLTNPESWFFDGVIVHQQFEFINPEVLGDRYSAFEIMYERYYSTSLEMATEDDPYNTYPPVWQEDLPTLGTNPTDTPWHPVRITFDGTTIRQFHNNVLVHSTTDLSPTSFAAHCSLNPPHTNTRATSNHQLTPASHDFKTQIVCMNRIEGGHIVEYQYEIPSNLLAPLFFGTAVPNSPSDDPMLQYRGNIFLSTATPTQRTEISWPSTTELFGSTLTSKGVFDFSYDDSSYIRYSFNQDKLEPYRSTPVGSDWSLLGGDVVSKFVAHGNTFLDMGAKDIYFQPEIIQTYSPGADSPGDPDGGIYFNIKYADLWDQHYFPPIPSPGGGTINPLREQRVDPDSGLVTLDFFIGDASFLDQPMPADTLFYYDMVTKSGTSLEDLGPNGNDGTNTQGDIILSDYREEAAYRTIDNTAGDSYIETGVTVVEDFTVCGWFHPTDTAVKTIWADSDWITESPENSRLHAIVSGNRLYVKYGDGTTSVQHTSNAYMYANNWSFISIRVSNGVLAVRQYSNSGERSSSMSYDSLTPGGVATGTIHIGEGTAGAYPFNGYIGPQLLVDRALTDEEILNFAKITSGNKVNPYDGYSIAPRIIDPYTVAYPNPSSEWISTWFSSSGVPVILSLEPTSFTESFPDYDGWGSWLSKGSVGRQLCWKQGTSGSWGDDISLRCYFGFIYKDADFENPIPTDFAIGALWDRASIGDTWTVTYVANRKVISRWHDVPADATPETEMTNTTQWASYGIPAQTYNDKSGSFSYRYIPGVDFAEFYINIPNDYAEGAFYFYFSEPVNMIDAVDYFLGDNGNYVNGDDWGFEFNPYGRWWLPGCSFPGTEGDTLYADTQAKIDPIFNNLTYEMLRVRELVPTTSVTTGSLFGNAMDHDGTRLITGAPNDSTVFSEAGSAFIIDPDSDGYIEVENHLTASDAVAGDHFGSAVAVNNTVAIVAAMDTASGGEVYEFNYSGSWTEQGKVTSPSRLAGTDYGQEVVLDGTYAYVSDPGATAADGIVYVMEKQGGSWVDIQQLTPPVSGSAGRFGSRIVIHDTVMMVTEPYSNNGISDQGSVHVYSLSGGTWSLDQTIVSEAIISGTGFGEYGIDFDFDYVDNPMLVIGAHKHSYAGEAGITGTNIGVVYIYNYTGGTWNYLRREDAHERIDNAEFGRQIVIGKDLVVVSSHGSGTGPRGEWFVYLNGGNNTFASSDFWTGQSPWTPSVGEGNAFGKNIIAKDGFLYVSDDARPIPRDPEFIILQKIVADDGGQLSDNYQFHSNPIVQDGDTIAAMSDSAVYVFVRDAGTGIWSQQQKITVTETTIKGGIDLKGNTLVFGSTEANDVEEDQGAVYVYTRSGTVWTQLQRILQESDPDEYTSAGNFRYRYNRFGTGVAIGSGKIAIARAQDMNAGSYFSGQSDPRMLQRVPAHGGIWIYDLDGTYVFNTGNRIPPSDITSDYIPWRQNSPNFGAGYMGFGHVMKFQGDTLLVGLPYLWREDTPGAEGPAGWSEDVGGITYYTKGPYDVVEDRMWFWDEDILVPGANAQQGSNFGMHFKLEGGRLLVGAGGDSTQFGTPTGRVWTYTGSGINWTFEQEIVSTESAADDMFGAFIGVNAAGDEMIVGSPQKNTGDGKAYVFKLVTGVWQQDRIIGIYPTAGTNNYNAHFVGISTEGNYLTSSPNDSTGSIQIHGFDTPPGANNIGSGSITVYR